LRWQGFRKVRRQVCKRVDSRRRELGLPDVAGYRAHLEARPEEWAKLDQLCWIDISRFYRDRMVFQQLEASSCLNWQNK
jgi:chemotaxis protein methyltransferase CheR